MLFRSREATRARAHDAHIGDMPHAAFLGDHPWRFRLALKPGFGPESGFSARAKANAMQRALSSERETCPLTPDWSMRRRWLRDFRRLVARQAGELARVVALEIGKSEGEAMVAEVLPLLAAIRWHERRAARVLRGHVARGRPAWLLGRRLRVARAPLGHVLVIATWNYPVGLLGVQLVQAIAAGNRVTVKASERSPRSQRMLVRLACSCGLPDGWIALADASREEGERLVRSGAFDHIVFTGSSDKIGRAHV